MTLTSKIKLFLCSLILLHSFSDSLAQSEHIKAEFKVAEKIILRNPEKALSIYENIVKKCTDSADFYNLSWTYIELARFYNKNSESEKMFINLLKAKALIQTYNDSILNYSFQHELTICYRGLLKLKPSIQQSIIEEVLSRSIPNDSIKMQAKSTRLLIFMGYYPDSTAIALEKIKEIEKINEKAKAKYFKGIVASLYCFYNNVTGNRKEAIVHNQNALEIFEQLKDTIKIIATNRMTANIYFSLEDYVKSSIYYKKSFDLAIKSLNFYYASENATDLAYCYGMLNDYNNLNKYAAIAEDCYNKTATYIDENYANTWLGDIYDQKGFKERASYYYKKLSETKDQIIVNSNADGLMNLEAELTNNYNLSLQKKEFEKEKQIKENEKKHQARLKNIFIIGFIILGILLIIAYKGYLSIKKSNKIIHKQKLEVEKQKHIVEEQHKEIRDSINYAQRIQNAILAPQDDIKKGFTDLFIFFKPKDIVSGDFYWYKNVENKNYIAAADCTGHGVPGAIVSVICSNSLNSAVGEYNKTTPGEILDTTKKIVVDTLAKNNNNVMDGMDISFLTVDYSKNEVQWAGAYNPLWIIDSKKNLVEIKADKQSIGKSDKTDAFTTHTLTVDKGSMLYLITDGYADQFGGSKGKKFKYKQLHEKLVAVSGQPVVGQKEIIENVFNEWKGNLEQIDDVCIVGVKI